MTARTLLLSFCLGGLTLPAHAQTTDAGFWEALSPSMATMTKTMHGTIRRNIAESAEAMTADDYGFKPTPQVRSFGELIGHVIFANYAMCSRATGQNPPVTTNFANANDRAVLIKGLNDALAYCDAAYAATFSEVFVRPWAAAFPAAVGFFAVALFAFLAATYLTVDAQDEELCEDFRIRGLAAAGAVFVCAAAALVLAHAAAPRMAIGVVGALLIQAATASAAIAAIAALWLRHYRVARLAAAAQVSLILWGWMVAQYPYLIPPTLTIRDAAAPAVTLRLLVLGLAVGAVILAPSLRYLMQTFKARRPG